MTTAQGSRPHSFMGTPEAELVLDLLDQTGAGAMRGLTEMYGRTFGPPLLGVTLTGDEMRSLRTAAEGAMRLWGPNSRAADQGPVGPDDASGDHGG